MGTKIAHTYSTFSDCCQELLEEREVNLDNYFDRIITDDKTWVYYYDFLSEEEAKIWKKAGEETPARFRRTRSTEKIMMVIFWDKYGILLIKYLPRETTISSSYYASIIERLRCAILEIHSGKVSDGVLLLHDNAPGDKCNIVQVAIRKAGFIELNHPAYSPGIAPSDYYLFLNSKKLLCSKNFSRDDETIDTVKDYLNNLD